MNSHELFAQFSGVASLKIHLPLKFCGALHLDVELFAHLGELIVDDGQNIGA